MNGDNSSRVRVNKYVLTDNTIFLKAKIIHGLVNRLLDLLPVRSSLNKFIHVLEGTVSPRKFRCRHKDYLRPIRSTITRGVSHDLCKILSVVHNKDVTEHLEMGEIRRDALNLVVPMSCEFSGAGDHPAHTFNPAMNAW